MPGADIQSRPRGRWWDPLAYLAFGGVGLALLGYGTALLLARTGGFQSMVEASLGRQLGLPVIIGGSRATWSGDMIFSDLAFGPSGADPDAPGLSVGRLCLATDWFRLLYDGMEAGVVEAKLEDWTLRFQLDGAGRWQPATFQHLAGWFSQWGGVAIPRDETRPASSAPGAAIAAEPGPGSPGGIVQWAQRWSQTRWVSSAGHIDWTDAMGRFVAVVEDLRFTVRPMPVPARRVVHYHVKVGRISTADLELRNMDLELLRTDQHYQILNLAVDRHPVSGPSR